MEESSHHHHRHQQQQLLLLHHHQQRQQQRPLPHNSRLGGLRGAAGEVVEVSGGHIVRSTGRKDRHSKVCTAKGLRDRRVRLSAHTAIQFYDVQDRLGYDRPSKAVDWLLKHAKASIDELAELPRWHPPTTTTNSSSNPSPPSHQHDLHEQPVPNEPAADQGAYSSATFLPPPLNSDSIADTIKTFFPMATTPASSSYQNYPPDLVSRSSNQAQDLRLSLQSFQDPMFHQNQTPAASSQQNFLSGNLAFGSASASWPEQNQRVVAWNLAETGDGGGGGGGGGGGSGGDGGYESNMPPPQAVPLHPALSLSQLFSQRGTLQSSNSLSVRAWMDPIAAAAGHQILPAGIHSSWPSVTATGFVFSDTGGFSGFHIPAWLQGEEEHGVISSKPPSDSSASNH